MAKVIYRVTAPDGTSLSRVASDFTEHTLAVLGLMRLRKPLPKTNPDDPNEEQNYHRHKAWVLIGTVDNAKSAEILTRCQGYRRITEETVVLPCAPEPFESDRPAPTWLHKKPVIQEVEV